MKTLQKISVLSIGLLIALFSQVSLADGDCGTFGIPGEPMKLVHVDVDVQWIDQVYTSINTCKLPGESHAYAFVLTRNGVSKTLKVTYGGIGPAGIDYILEDETTFYFYRNGDNVYNGVGLAYYE
jgi:hypothetical protein